MSFVSDCVSFRAQTQPGLPVRYSEQLQEGLSSSCKEASYTSHFSLIKEAFTQAGLVSAIPFILRDERLNLELEICSEESASGLACMPKAWSVVTIRFSDWVLATHSPGGG